MATTEEYMKVLEMIQAGNIDAEQGWHLLQALGLDAVPSGSGKDPCRLRIRITIFRTGQALGSTRHTS